MGSSLKISWCCHHHLIFLLFTCQKKEKSLIFPYLKSSLSISILIKYSFQININILANSSIFNNFIFLICSSNFKNYREKGLTQNLKKKKWVSEKRTMKGIWKSHFYILGVGIVWGQDSLVWWVLLKLFVIVLFLFLLVFS